MFQVFLLVKSAPIHVIGWDFFETHDTYIHISPAGEMYLELNESEAKPIEKMIFKKPPQEETNPESQHLLQGISMELWALSSTNIE